MSKVVHEYELNLNTDFCADLTIYSFLQLVFAYLIKISFLNLLAQQDSISKSNTQLA